MAVHDSTVERRIWFDRISGMFWSLTIAYALLCILAPSTGLANEEEISTTITQRLVNTGVKRVVCADDQLLKLASLSPRRCEPTVEETFLYCWDRMSVLFPDIDTVDRETGRAKEALSDEALKSILFFAKKCVQASILLDESATETGSASNDSTSVETARDDVSVPEELSFESVMKVAAHFQTENADSRSKLITAILRSDYDYVSLSDDGGIVLASAIRDGTRKTDVFSVGSEWSNLMVSAGIVAVRRTDSETFLTAGEEYLGDGKRFRIEFYSGDLQDLPKCRVSFSRVECGACKLDSINRTAIWLRWLPTSIGALSERQDSGLDSSHARSAGDSSQLRDCYDQGMAEILSSSLPGESD